MIVNCTPYQSVTVLARILKISSRRVCTIDGERPATITAKDGHIAAIDEYDPSAGVDYGWLALLPGMTDTHVHFNEPGRTEWEGFATGTRAAAAGGVTLAVDMPLNSLPVTTTVDSLEQKRHAARDKLAIDVGFYGGVVPDNESQIAGLAEAGVLGFKAFLCNSGIDEFPAATQRELSLAMKQIATTQLPLLVHAELTSAVPPMAHPSRYADYLATRPPRFERDAIELLIDLCRKTRCRTHIVHLSDAGSLPMLRQARQQGLPITVETCPHYLYFSSEYIADGACQFKCSPPIRDSSNNWLLWQALVDGDIDFVTSDHSPCPPEEKQLTLGRFDLAWGGISSVQLTLPILWTLASRRGVPLGKVLDWLSTQPAKFVGRESGLKVGAEASIVVFDTEAEFTVRGAELRHRHPTTPYNGETLRGIVRQTYLRGVPAVIGIGEAL